MSVGPGRSFSQSMAGKEVRVLGLNFVIYLFVLQIYDVCAAPKKKNSIVGKCSRKRCTRNAQTGFIDAKGNRYCKVCFAEVCPKLSDAKKNARKKECQVCGESTELTSGICRPCRRARTCDGCQKVNEKANARVCKNCAQTTGARCPKLALWCTTCTTVEERSHRVCRNCLGKREQSCSSQCGFCKTDIQELSVLVKCEK